MCFLGSHDRFERAVCTDHIGRPSFATDGSGAKVWEGERDQKSVQWTVFRANDLPFGGVHVTTGTNVNIRYPGQWFQVEAGLHKNWMRDYDPTLGRYLQADPLGLVDGPAVYNYALQSPNRYVDPRGEFGILGAVIGAATNAAIQFGLNYLKHGDLLAAARCIDIKDVAASAAFGAIGASPFGVLKSGGTVRQAAGVAGITTFTKKVLAPTPIRIGDECECGQANGPLGDIARGLQF